MLHRFSGRSCGCRDVLPGTSLLISSESIGWQSMLVRHCRNSGYGDVYETRPTPDQLIVVHTRGAVDLESFSNGRWRKAIYHAGAAGMTSPGEVDRLRWRLRPGCEAFENLHLFLPQDLILEAIEHFRRPGQRDLSGPFSSLIFRNGALAEVGHTLLAAIQAGAPNLYAEATAQWLAVHLISARLGSGEADDGRRPGPITDARLVRATEYMSTHLADDISLDVLAAEAGASKFHFVRLFRERFGETPIRYLVNLRLETAARLLATSDLPVGQIAFECGYPNIAHFSGVFRRRYGRSPDAYRRGR